MKPNFVKTMVLLIKVGGRTKEKLVFALFWFEEAETSRSTDLTGGRQKARENVKKSHACYLSLLLLPALSLSSFPFHVRGHQHATTIT